MSDNIRTLACLIPALTLFVSSASGRNFVQYVDVSGLRERNRTEQHCRSTRRNPRNSQYQYWCVKQSRYMFPIVVKLGVYEVIVEGKPSCHTPDGVVQVTHSDGMKIDVFSQIVKLRAKWKWKFALIVIFNWLEEKWYGDFCEGNMRHKALIHNLLNRDLLSDSLREVQPWLAVGKPMAAEAASGYIYVTMETERGAGIGRWGKRTFDDVNIRWQWNAMHERRELLDPGFKELTQITDPISSCDLLITSGQNARHFADDIFRYNFVNEKVCILIKSLFLRVQLIITQHWSR